MTTTITTIPMKMKAFLLLMAATLLVGVMAVTPNRADGFSYFNYGPDPIPLTAYPIKVCLEGGGFTTTLDDTAVQSAVNAWNAQIFDRDFIVSCVGATVHIKPPSQWNSSIFGGDPMVTERLWSQGTLHANIWVNPGWANEFWFYTSNQNCYVPWCDKSVDYYSSILHELGHALGLGHNSAGLPVDSNGNRVAQCAGGYYFGDPASACWNDFYSVDIMYFAAADGYRRQIQQDSINGLGGLGYRS